MKYYIVELKNITNRIGKLHLDNESTIYKILTDHCLIKDRGGKLYKYIIQDNNADIKIKNFIKDYTLLGTDFFEKRIDQIYHIPFDHHLLKIKKYIYSMSGRTKFVVEKQNDKIIDFYFVSKDKYTNFSLKEDSV